MEFIAPYSTVLTQLLVAMLLGMLVGTERTIAGKAAGLRTYGIVSLGSCLFVVIALTVGTDVFYVDMTSVMRVVAGIITGIGFLGAGVIILRGETPTGLTTAAGLWVASGIGIAVGFGLYHLAVFATILTLIAFTVFWFIERTVAKMGNGNGGMEGK